MLSDPRRYVLCVDDDEDTRVMLTTLLRFALIEAKAVRTAAQALSSIQTERFHMYLMDARLPEIDGFELCRRIRGFDQDTPILFFSGAAFESDKKRGIEAGANAYVTKPDVSGLLTTVNQLMSRDAQQPVAQEVRSWTDVCSVSGFAMHAHGPSFELHN